jgi:HNH endonuclease
MVNYGLSDKDLEDKFLNQGGKCCYCLAFLDNSYHIDHLTPKSKGGDNGFYNLVISCQLCNLLAGNKLFNNFNEKRNYILMMLYIRGNSINYYPNKDELKKTFLKFKQKKDDNKRINKINAKIKTMVVSLERKIHNRNRLLEIKLLKEKRKLKKELMLSNIPFIPYKLPFYNTAKPWPESEPKVVEITYKRPFNIKYFSKKQHVILGEILNQPTSYPTLN